jgi:hypothetical protein
MSLLPAWAFRSTRACRRYLRYRDAFQVRLDSAGDAPWTVAARSHLTKSDLRLAQHDLDGAWNALVDAQREEIPTLRGVELRNREMALRCEAVKVDSPWRRCAIDGFMKEDTTDEAERALRLAAAQGLLDDFYQTQYYRDGLLRVQMGYLVWISLSALVALLALIGWAGSDLSGWPEWDWKSLTVVLLFGVLGASFSATRKLSDGTGKSKVPELASNVTVTLARTVLGSTPALAAYAFLKSGIVTFVAGGGNKTPMAVVLAVAFAAGFSERLVLKVLESIDTKPVGGSEKADKKPAAKTATP